MIVATHKISFITFTRNSGKRLQALLENVKDVVDEMIIIDGYSTDDTVEIAKSYGAKVFSRRPWGYVEPDRMFALKKASYDWVLYLDDDELLGRKLKNELRELICKASKEGFAALNTARVNYDVKYRQIIFGMAYPDRQIRIYRRDRVLYRGIVHEMPKIFGEILELPEEYFIIHYGSLSTRKIVMYAYLESFEHFTHPARPIRRALWKLLPFSAPFLVTYRLVHDLAIRKNPYINLGTVIRTIYPNSFYEMLVHTLIRFRGKRGENISKLVSEHGLIKLLNLEDEQ